MTNLECVTWLLAKHREARAWADGTVAEDVLAQLGVDPKAEATKAEAPPDAPVPTEDEVKAAEAAAKDADDKAKAARAALDASKGPSEDEKAAAATAEADKQAKASKTVRVEAEPVKAAAPSAKPAA